MQNDTMKIAAYALGIGNVLGAAAIYVATGAINMFCASIVIALVIFQPGSSPLAIVGFTVLWALANIGALAVLFSDLYFKFREIQRTDYEQQA